MSEAGDSRIDISRTIIYSLALLLIAGIIAISIPNGHHPGPNITNEIHAIQGLRELLAGMEMYHHTALFNDTAAYLPGEGEGKLCALYYAQYNPGEPINMINQKLANADYRGDGTLQEPQQGTFTPADAEPIIFTSEPYRGYWFALCQKRGATILDAEAARHHFTIAAFPFSYGHTGKRTFLMSEDGIIYSRDLGGSGYIAAVPEEPSVEGWEPYSGSAD